MKQIYHPAEALYDDKNPGRIRFFLMDLKHIKTLVSFLFLLTFLQPIFAQEVWEVFDTQKKASYYLEKSKQQKKTGWILFGVGTTIAVVGITGFNSSWNSDIYSTTDNFGYLMLGGIVLDIVSIPFFISSGVNKQKARKIAINGSSIIIHEWGTNIASIRPGVSLKLDL